MFFEANFSVIQLLHNHFLSSISLSKNKFWIFLLEQTYLFLFNKENHNIFYTPYKSVCTQIILCIYLKHVLETPVLSAADHPDTVCPDDCKLWRHFCVSFLLFLHQPSSLHHFDVRVPICWIPVCK